MVRIFGVILVAVGVGSLFAVNKFDFRSRWKAAGWAKRTLMSVILLIVAFVVAQCAFIGEYAIIYG